MRFQKETSEDIDCIYNRVDFFQDYLKRKRKFSPNLKIFYMYFIYEQPPLIIEVVKISRAETNFENLLMVKNYSRSLEGLLLKCFY